MGNRPDFGGDKEARETWKELEKRRNEGFVPPLESTETVVLAKSGRLTKEELEALGFAHELNLLGFLSQDELSIGDDTEIATLSTTLVDRIREERKIEQEIRLKKNFEKIKEFLGVEKQCDKCKRLIVPPDEALLIGSLLKKHLSQPLLWDVVFSSDVLKGGRLFQHCLPILEPSEGKWKIACQGSPPFAGLPLKSSIAWERVERLAEFFPKIIGRFAALKELVRRGALVPVLYSNKSPKKGMVERWEVGEFF